MNRLKMMEYTIRVRTVPTVLAILVGGEQERVEVRTIWGYTLKDAKRRAGIR